jgi:regulator of sirC expression with transglutaminase-like and TPR domain
MDLNAALTLLTHEPDAPLDLAELALCLARDEYAELDVDAYLCELNGMAHEAGRYLRGDLEARVTGLCRYLFHEMGFRGNAQEYYDPLNSYLNQVLDRRTGIPITLSAVAIAVGSRANLRIVGVGLPGHFVAKAVEDGEEIIFDPFHGGRRLAVEQCERLVERLTGEPFQATPAVLQPVPTKAFALRMLTNLKGSYLRLSDFARAARVICRLMQLTPDDPLQDRDLGVCLLHAGQPGRAIEHLSRYLATPACSDDEKNVRQLLERARTEVAKWN